MYSEDLEEENRKRLQKELDYEKWKNRNPHATKKQKSIAKRAHDLADNFNLPDVDSSWWEEIPELSIEDWKKNNL